MPPQSDIRVRTPATEEVEEVTAWERFGSLWGGGCGDGLRQLGGVIAGQRALDGLSAWGGACVVLVGTLSVGCVPDQRISSATLLPDLSIVTGDVWSLDDGESIRFKTARSLYGASAGELAFGSIIDIAVGPEGLLAIADILRCEVTFVDRTSGTAVNRVGACGGGPGEFRQLRAIAFSGDSLVAFDQGSGALVFFDTAGNESARHHIEVGGGIAALHVVDEARLLVAIEGTGDAPVGLLDVETGSLIAELFAQPRVSAIGPQRTMWRLSSCLRREGTRSLAVVMNSWAFEGAAVWMDGQTEEFHFLTDVGVEPFERSDGSWGMGNVSTDVVCSASGALFKMTVPKDAVTPGQLPPPGVTYLEMRTYQGDLMFRQVVTDSGSLLHGRPGAMRGDTLFVVSNRSHGFPVVAEFFMGPAER